MRQIEQEALAELPPARRRRTRSAPRFVRSRTSGQRGASPHLSRARSATHTRGCGVPHNRWRATPQLLWREPHMARCKNPIRPVAMSLLPVALVRISESRGPAIGVMALVGTTKGLFLLCGDDHHAPVAGRGPAARRLGGVPRDARPPRWHAARRDQPPRLRIDQSSAQRTPGGRGRGRSRSACPRESGLTLDAVWHIEPGRTEEPGRSFSGQPRARCFAPTMAATAGR